MNYGLVSISKLLSYAHTYEEELFTKTAVVRKLPSGKWTVKSLKGKNLGEYDTKGEAVKRLRQIEYFKHHPKKSKKRKKKAADEHEEGNSYSSVMRDLRKSYDEETVHKFQTTFKQMFDEALKSGSEDPEKDILDKALSCIDYEDDKKAMEKAASSIDLGDPQYAGKYLADVLKFLMRRISQERRTKSLENLRKKIYYLNEYEIASKKVPPSSAIGQSITLLKHILLEHNPEYIRNVLNSIVRNLP